VALIFKLSGVFIGYLFFWILAMLYGAQGVGVFSSLWTILMVNVVIAKLGFDTSIVKYIASFYSQKKFSLIPKIYKKGVLWITLTGIVVTGLLMLLSAPLSQLFFETTEFNYLIIIVAISIIPLSLINYNAEALKGLKNITGFSIFQNGTVYIATLVIIGIFYLFEKSETTINHSVYSLGIGLVLLLPISFLFIKKTFERKGNNQKTFIGELPFTNREILKTTLPMLLSNSLFLIMSWTDILMLSAFKPEAEVGIYNTAIKIAALNSIVLVAVNSIAMPKYAELYERKDSALFKNFVKQTTLLIFIISLPILLVIFIFPEFMLGIFGSEFETGRDALLILAGAQFFSAISGSTIHILNMAGKEIIARNILTISTLLNIVLNFILIPDYGILGAAIATGFTTILWNGLAVWFIYRKFGFLTYPFKVKIRK
jgi:O-antigen/teichoic acid export membrane protein